MPRWSRTTLAEAPIFAETAAVIGDVQVRNRGSFGGSLAHADPAADWPAVFLALGGEARMLGPKGRRSVSADDFFVGMLQSALGEDEILTELVLPLETKRAGAAYRKLRQPASGFAIVGAAVQLRPMAGPHRRDPHRRHGREPGAVRAKSVGRARRAAVHCGAVRADRRGRPER
jgi:carbon-monoxide dehydrogenase medium subunit